jgi:hypothetical protein
MSQSTFDEDDLFGEAASEMRGDVEASLEAAWAELPSDAEIWDVEADNILGALNALKSALDVGEARNHLRDAKKWYTMGERAGAFDDADDLQEEIERLEGVLEDIESAGDQVGDLTGTIPGLKSALEDAGETTDE